jgi:hypothetical protein
LSSRRHEADYRLLVDVDQAAWKAAENEAATFTAAASEYLRSAWPNLKLRVGATAI